MNEIAKAAITEIEAIFITSKADTDKQKLETLSAIAQVVEIFNKSAQELHDQGDKDAIEYHSVLMNTLGVVNAYGVLGMLPYTFDKEWYK